MDALFSVFRRYSCLCMASLPGKNVGMQIDELRKMKSQATAEMEKKSSWSLWA